MISVVKRGRGRASLVASPLLAVVLALLTLGPAFADPGAGRAAKQLAAADARADEPKVVIIVGPTQELTNYFRREAEDAARVARKFTADVTTIYSPDATWAAVRPALQGADVVVYMGHGNGWPSRYRDSLYRPTQNGLGLNPPGARDDSVHRYYGERYLAREVELADGAVVLLHHLCYAAGNSEPGLPEGPRDVARQRVDNYAAGWLAAGAVGVVAEPYFAPRYYVEALLGSKRSIENIWRSSPSDNANVEEFASSRTASAVGLLDPDPRSGRYERSLVVLEDGRSKRARGKQEETPARPQLDAGDDVVDAADDAVDPAEEPVAIETGVPDTLPPLAAASVQPPIFHGAVVAGEHVKLSLPLALRADSASAAGIEILARWEPVADGSSSADADSVVEERVASGMVHGYLEVSLTAPATPGSYALSLTLRDDHGRLRGRSGKLLARGVEVEVGAAQSSVRETSAAAD